MHDCSPYLQGRALPQRMPIGLPLAGRELRVLGPDLAPLPRGAAGELCIGGELLARGYLGRPALSAERFVADPFCRQARGASTARATSCAGTMPAKLEYLGRIDHQVKVRGLPGRAGRGRGAAAGPARGARGRGGGP